MNESSSIPKRKWQRAILESPFAGNVDRNRAYAIQCMRNMILQEEAPFASHLLYPLALGAQNRETRKRGMNAGLVWTEAADVCIVYEDFGLSDGMKQGIEHAVKLKIPVLRRRLW